MAKAKVVNQLSFDMGDRPGLLAEVTEALAGAKVNVNYVCAYEMDGRAYFMLVTDSGARAKKALAGLGIKAEEEKVIAVEMPNRVGELQKVARKIAEAGVNISYIDATAFSGRTATCILSTSDDRKVARLINR
jgi:hypothetical protein